MLRKHWLRAALSLLLMFGTSASAYFIVLLPDNPLQFWNDIIFGVMAVLFAIVVFTMFFWMAWHVVGWVTNWLNVPQK